MHGIYLGVIEFNGYREWTESIGSDREWILQITQSRIYLTLQEAAARVDGFILPLRYDYMLLVASGLGDVAISKIYHVAESISPVPVRMATACGSTPLEAVDTAWEKLPRGVRGLVLGDHCVKDYVVAAHFDINGITQRTRDEGVIATYTAVLALISKIQEKARSHGAITQYLGGDNVLALLPYHNYDSIAFDLLSLEDLKVGIGVAKSSRRALTLAAEALHHIRARETPNRIVILKDL